MTNTDDDQDAGTVYPSRSLRLVHILLISTSTAFAVGFAVLQLTRDESLWAVGSFLAGIGLSVYLRSFIRRTT